MGKILDFKQKRQTAEFETHHTMWVTQDEQWVIWRCHTCARKLKLSKTSNRMVIERKGDFFAQHTTAITST